MRCIGLAIDGKRCRAQAVGGTELCSFHLRKEREARLDRKRRLETVPEPIDEPPQERK